MKLVTVVSYFRLFAVTIFYRNLTIIFSFVHPAYKPVNENREMLT